MQLFDVIMWAVAVVVFVLAEVMTVQMVSIWFAVGAAITLACVFLFEDVTLLQQLCIFIAASSIFLLLTIPFMKKRRNKGFTETNANLDVGKSAVVIEEINTDSGTGRVTLNGVDWSAVPADKNSIIPKDSIVTVVRVNGAKLIVEPKSK